MKVYGPPFSSNTTPAAVLGLDTGAAEFVVCKLWEGEHKTEPMMKINPMGACPLADDEGVNMAEGNTILRYIASKYAPELYGGQDAAVKSKIDWVLDWEATSLNPKYNKIWPGVVGFADPPEDQKAANEAFTADLAIFEKAFLSNSKFITGDTLSITDYRVALRCFNLHNPTIKAKTGFECSERIQKYISDFEASSKNAKDFLRSGHDGFNANDFTTNIPFKK